jgi:hypothetical protein
MTNEQPLALKLAEELDCQKHINAAAELRRLHAENAKLREALEDAATSLQTIGRLAGKSAYLSDNGERIPTYMEHHDEVRGYAKSRASVARAALAQGEKK